jgi:hypothetical protein
VLEGKSVASTLSPAEGGDGAESAEAAVG